jgi:hypothetical protein
LWPRLIDFVLKEAGSLVKSRIASNALFKINPLTKEVFLESNFEQSHPTQSAAITAEKATTGM